MGGTLKLIPIHGQGRAGIAAGSGVRPRQKRFSRLVGLGLGIFRSRTSRSGASPRVFNSQSPAEPQECQAGLSARPSGIPGQKAALWGIKSLRDSRGLFKAAANGVAGLENARHRLLPAPEREKSGAESKNPPNLIFYLKVAWQAHPRAPGSRDPPFPARCGSCAQDGCV